MQHQVPEVNWTTVVTVTVSSGKNTDRTCHLGETFRARPTSSRPDGVLVSAVDRLDVRGFVLSPLIVEAQTSHRSPEPKHSSTLIGWSHFNRP
ncbi:uncharacterized protein V6R79_018743 [Siganus canaliculatus]